MIVPAFDQFASGYEAGKPQVVSTELVADLATPVSTFLKLTKDQPWSFLFDSVEGGAFKGRYSIMGTRPDLIFRAFGNKPEVNRTPQSGSTYAPLPGGALDELRNLVGACEIELPDHIAPMSAGLYGYLGYDAVRLMEKLPEPNPDTLGIPDLLFTRPTIVAVFDSVRDTLTIVTPVWPQEGVTAKAAYLRATERLEAAIADVEAPLELPAAPENINEIVAGEVTSNTALEDYFAIVEKAKEYIRAGDIFQVVPSQRFETPFPLPAFDLFRALRRTNPSPYMYYLNLGDFQVSGSSPEILVQLRDEKVTIRPIAGTRPRGATPEEDRKNHNDLLADPKELSEHLMLLDLGRNDVGRVAKVGTVEVTDQFFIERYSHVMHIVSNVEGELRDDHDGLSALIAGFPAGTVSGAPKVRAMEIIDELEKEKRGLYAGGVGYFSANGDMDTAIVLRTGIVKDGKLYVQAGGGVVADSNPQYEYDETVNKSKAVFRAAEEAIRHATQDLKRQ
ncbi:MAG: anthranilate synthase component I [Alphaproteobacteria bacterium]